MKKLLPLLFAFSVLAQDSPYDSIASRNAFTLLSDEPKILPPITDLVKPRIKLYLTGITKFRGVTSVYFFSQDVPKKFHRLTLERRTDEGVTLLSVDKGLVKVLNNGVAQTLSFNSHKNPSVVAAGPSKKPTVIKKPSKSSKGKSPQPSEPKASIIKVPSRRPQVDPKIIEKSLEYISRSEDSGKKEYIMKRLEDLQSGQSNLKSNIDQNERRRQQDEWKKRREGK